ncbi:NitT/TauT family transport system permease protein/taurine transport system permease protein [Ruminiclostridium sufflavum DSM 19573]|uniref:NitT/TauT family transport system permease protein/taurine transport system permease protein n=2 Tax=Ruminiclostridium TaxID=1508657 RepID=A0A318YAD8_9FIRM|nr:NitT/TauT family transport system permease protein/taurine transport system permease protein [Ruminiclostridium sufflavum DSM 19573]
MTNDSELLRQQARQQELKYIKNNKRKMMIFSILSITALLLIWHFVVTFRLVNTRFLESPVTVINTIITKFTDINPDGGYLHQHIIESAKVVWVGFLVGSLVGIPLGLFMGWYRIFDHLIRPLFEMVRPIPALAWIPIVLLFLGIGVAARSAIIFFGSFVGIVLNTYVGVRQTNQVLINVAKTCGASNFEIFYKIGIPSAMPMIFTGLKTAMGAAWATVVAAEMLSASKGLGYMIQMGRMYGEVSLILAGIIVIGIFGLISSWMIGCLEDIVLKWRPKNHEN